MAPGNSVELKSWKIRFGAGAPLAIMAGLNVLEDESLALETATELKRITGRLGIPFIFKASFDKANRSSIASFRGPGLEKGLKQLEAVKSKVGVAIVTDIHEPDQAERASRVADVVQIPAFLCRQTDLVVAGARAVEKNGGLLQVKKAQFLAPWDCKNIISKIREAAPSRPLTILCERGSSFGYNNLVVDMLAIPEMQKLGVPVTLDATHAVQLPGAAKGAGGEGTATGGRREGVELLARAGVAVGVDGVFLEFHPDPAKAKCDGPSCLPLAEAEGLFKRLLAIREALS